MTTGRINQVATVVAAGARPPLTNFHRRPAGPHGVVVTRSAEPARSRSSRRTRTKTRQAAPNTFVPRRPDGPRIGRSRRGPDRGRPFLSPSRHPLRGRNTQDRQARNEPTRVAHRSDLDRQTTQVDRRDACRTAGTLAPVAAGRPRDCLVSRGRARRSKANRSRTSLDVVQTGRSTDGDSDANASRRPPSPCRVRTLHCRFTYKAAHRAAGYVHPE